MSVFREQRGTKDFDLVVTSSEHCLSIKLFAADVNGWLMSLGERVLKGIVTPFILNIFFNN